MAAEEAAAVCLSTWAHRSTALHLENLVFLFRTIWRIENDCMHHDEHTEIRDKKRRDRMTNRGGAGVQRRAVRRRSALWCRF